MIAEQAALPLEPAPSPPAPRFWRLVRETTKRAWYVVREQLEANERAVYFGLMAYWNRHQHWPTAYELYEFLEDLKHKHPNHPRYRRIKDINNVRPRLSMMNQYDPPLVVTGEKRRCTSQRRAGSLMYVWRIPQLGEPVRAGPNRSAA